jgi:Flp pilus assembly protein TadD
MFSRVGIGRLAALALALLPGHGLVAADLKPSPLDPRSDRVARWIEDLGHPAFAVRERAEADLLAQGFAAFDALSVAEESADLEISQRARFLLRSMTAHWVRESDPPAVHKILDEYEQKSDQQRADAMERLALMPDDAGVSALCRLARYEKSPLLSKRAALEVMFLPGLGEARAATRAAIIERELGESPRTAAAWLRAYLQAGKGDRAALDAWAELAEDENRQFELAPDETDVQTASLLFYAYAQACAALGDTARAEQVAQRAWSLQPDDSTAHYLVAGQLSRRGLFDWSEREYRRLIELSPSADEPMQQPYALSSRLRLAETMHDQGRELPAAEVLDGLVALMDDKEGGAQVKKVLMETLVRDPEGIRSRAQYFRALHLLTEGRREEALARLEQGVKEDFADADVLISLYELGADDPGLRSRTMAQVAKAVAEYRLDIERMPQDHQGYNQLAWLLANTGGGAAEAIALSHRSLELSPDTASYLDTLAHCYAANHDFENAVKHQTRAAELDPHSGLIRKKLDVFRQAAAKEAGE